VLYRFERSITERRGEEEEEEKKKREKQGTMAMPHWLGPDLTWV
jgi:hypothetical protein